MNHDLTTTETALRESLATHALSPASTGGGDPWVRIERAHRRSRTRRRTALAGAVTAVLVTGATLATTPWSPTADHARPADPAAGLNPIWLDDGRPRGALGNAVKVRDAVSAGLRAHDVAGGGPRADLARIDVLYADVRGANVIALARMTADRHDGTADSMSVDSLYWLAGSAGRSVQSPVLSVRGRAMDVSEVPVIAYTAADGAQHLLGVVPREADVSAGHTTIDAADSRVHRTWKKVRPADGVVDLSLGFRGGGSEVLQVKDHGETGRSGPVGLSALQPDGLTPTPLPMSAVRAALAGALGSGVDAGTTGTAAVADLLTSIGATFDRVNVKVLWAGPDPAGGGDLVAVAAGEDGQGRVLHVSSYADGDPAPRWTYATTIPAQGPIGMLGWRVGSPRENRDVVGWLFDRKPGGDVVVDIDGRERTTSLIDGLGLVEVAPDQVVKATQDRGTLILGPEARDDGSSPFAPGR